MLDKPAFPYGAGFRSVTEEIASPVALSVTGALPSWLKGALLRTGPSKFEVGARTYNHWFDGLAMLHRFALADGGVTYTNRFLESKAFRAAGRPAISYAEFATDPCTLFGASPRSSIRSSLTIAASTSPAMRAKSSHYRDLDTDALRALTRSRRLACSAIAGL
jgi:carotenoid cleavage dioxygenase-like enzyme